MATSTSALPTVTPLEELLQREHSKAELTESAERYIDSHPQLTALINDFLTACLTFQPADVHAYARQYFSSFHPRATNRPVLDGDMAALLTARTPREPTSATSDKDSSGSSSTVASQQS